jgi:hypothetical protein
MLGGSSLMEYPILWRWGVGPFARTIYPLAGDRRRTFIKTGEFRPPKRGEHYLSGAIPEVYGAPNDLRQPYDIMSECRIVGIPLEMK